MDYASEIDPSWLEQAQSVGLTSGASVPEILVREVVQKLAEYGFTDVEELRTATENIAFSLPKNLRADLKAAEADGEGEPRPFTPAANRPLTTPVSVTLGALKPLDLPS